jgi:myo-inositol 2-dehydrogenase/D-chiro-inositol 1-dehydrogenase
MGQLPAAVDRRRFISGTIAAAAAPLVLPGRSSAAEGVPPSRQVKLGVVGCGGRGAWIAGLFRRHGGYAIHAVADYFPAVSEARGGDLGVDRVRRFSGLSGYKRLIDSGVEAVALETPPCFFPAHALAAADAGLHVFMAKPVAVDVPGCRAIEAAAAKAKEGKRCFLVDYQMPTDPLNIEVIRRIAAGEIGAVAAIHSHYLAGQFGDPPLGSTIEGRLQQLIWCNDVAIGGGYHVNACIHAVDGVLWAAGKAPSAAMGASRRMRPDPHGDSHDTFSIVFEFEGGLTASHRGKHISNGSGFDVVVTVQGRIGFGQVCYGGTSFLRVPGKPAFEGQVENPYEAGAVRNIAAFHRDIVAGNSESPTVRRSIDGCLATILGREAALRRTRVTMEEILKESRAVEADLRGLRD